MDEQNGRISSSGDFAPASSAGGDAAKGFVGRVPHVLVVDADPEIACPLRDRLAAEGYRVTWIQTGRQAAAALRGPVVVDLLILDYFNPPVNGPGLLQDIAAHAFMQKPPVVVASGWLNEFHPAWMAQRKRLPPVAKGLIKAYAARPYSLTRMDSFLRDLLGQCTSPSAEARRSPFAQGRSMVG